MLPIAVVLLALALALLYAGRTKLAWVLPGLILIGSQWPTDATAPPAPLVVAAALFGVAVLVLGVPFVRRRVVTGPIQGFVGKILPPMSETERIALEAGTVWWDGELFSGRPNWSKWFGTPTTGLTEEEKRFIDGPVEELCQLSDNWEDQERGDLSETAWQFLKENGFFGMIIPKEYGGLEFSAQAHSAVVAKLASRSAAFTVTAMVPNSLGPGELLAHYGTDEQKSHYLPRLASGEEIPCFALTEPGAGSDAGAMTSHGVVCTDIWEGKETLGIRLTWEKRYITLAPIATLLGLAFKLRDPDGLLGDVEDIGITCALIPTHLPGVENGQRHDPLGCPFMNGPTRGTEVFVPIDAIIGGREMAGKGWMMLMQTLSVGRGISLPSMSAGASQLCLRVAGAHASVREQFGMPVGRFEGVQEPLVRIAGLSYAMTSVRKVTAGAVDAGEKPSVVSAIAKAYTTESLRTVINDAMDIVAGGAICKGPRNNLSSAYESAPIGVTVEGANILTRTMIIFGQGAIRCHPFVQDEMAGVVEGDRRRFDHAFFGHVGFVASNTVRSLLLGLTDGRLASSGFQGSLGRSQRRLTRMSAAFSLCADAAMGTLGGSLKRKERLTGRLADTLSWMYIASAALKRFHEDGRPERDRAVVAWVCEHALHEAQAGLDGFLRNLPNRAAALALRPVVFPLGARYSPPSDRLGERIVRGLLDGGELFEALTADVVLPSAEGPGLFELEDALRKVKEARPIEDAVKTAVREKRLAKQPAETLFARAEKEGIIDTVQLEQVQQAQEARRKAVTVDSFPPGVAVSTG